MRVVHEGWLYKFSTKKVGGQHRRLYAVLSTRAVYFFREKQDVDPAAYIRLEGLGVRAVALKGRACSFELYATSQDGSKDEPDQSSANRTGIGRVLTHGRIARVIYRGVAWAVPAVGVPRVSRLNVGPDRPTRDPPRAWPGTGHPTSAWAPSRRHRVSPGNPGRSSGARFAGWWGLPSSSTLR